MANLTTYIIGMKHDIGNKVRALRTTKGLLHRFKISRTLVHKRFKIWPVFSPTLSRFCVLLHCQASHTETEVKLRQTKGGKWR